MPAGTGDQDPEVGRRLLERLRLVRGVNIEDDARVPLLGPRQEALGIRFDEADRAVNHVRFGPSEIRGDLLHECDQVCARDINLRDHFRSSALGSELLIQFDMVIVDVLGKLVGIRPVQLTVRRQIVR